MIIGCSWSWIVPMIARWWWRENEGGNCHSAQGCDASAWWTFPFYSHPFIHFCVLCVVAAQRSIHRKDSLTHEYAAKHLFIVLARLLLLLPYGNCKLCVKPLPLSSSTTTAAPTAVRWRRKIPVMSMKICIIIISNLRVSYILIHYWKKQRVNSKRETGKPELSFSISKQSRILDYKLRTRPPQSKVSYSSFFFRWMDPSDEIKKKSHMKRDIRGCERFFFHWFLADFGTFSSSSFRDAIIGPGLSLSLSSCSHKYIRPIHQDQYLARLSSLIYLNKHIRDPIREWDVKRLIEFWNLLLFAVFQKFKTYISRRSNRRRRLWMSHKNRIFTFSFGGGLSLPHLVIRKLKCETIIVRMNGRLSDVARAVKISHLNYHLSEKGVLYFVWLARTEHSFVDL